MTEKNSSLTIIAFGFIYRINTKQLARTFEITVKLLYTSCYTTPINLANTSMSFDKGVQLIFLYSEPRQ
jgi:hypothetical protein